MTDGIVSENPLVKLRRATVGDLEELTLLQQAAYAANREVLGVEPLPLLADYRSVLSDYEVWIAGSGQLEGALVLDRRTDHLLIWSVATAPACQGKGVGNALMAAAEARAKNLGLTTLRLYTGEKLTRRVGWYHRLGFVIERVEELDDRRLVHMIKIIK